MIAAGRLDETVLRQEALVADRPLDAEARLLLVELLALAGRYRDARGHLSTLDSDDPAWPEAKRSFARLLKAARIRQSGRKPYLPDPMPAHLKYRLGAMLALAKGDPALALRRVDKAEKVTPTVTGHLDGREFEGLRDADDRFASCLEVFADGDYAWVPWDHLRTVQLYPTRGILDTVLRPARIRFHDGNTVDVHLPLVYPASEEYGETFALGQDADYVNTVSGPVRCVGAKTLMVGEEEIALADVNQIDLRLPR
jgi:type VI secretion system protein ImpE